MSYGVARNSLSQKSAVLAVGTVVLLEAALVVSWSGGFVGVRFALAHGPIFLLLFWRSFAAGLLLLPVSLLRSPKVNFRDLFQQVLLGALAMAGYLAGFALAISYSVPTGLVALIADMLPLAVAVLSWPILGQALTPKLWFGSFLGFAGVLIASEGSLHAANTPFWAYSLPLLGTFSLAVATLVQKRVILRPQSMLQSLCIQCLTASSIFALCAWHEGTLLPVLDIGFIGGVLWLVFVATFGGYGLYYLALAKSSPARVTAILYLSPPVTMIWAWLMFGEPLSWAMAVGLIVSLLGIIVVARSGETVH